MKLHWSPRSPFVRKVAIVIHELGLGDRIENIRSVVAATKPNVMLQAINPLSKIPTLELDDGRTLYDSPVICEYLDTLHNGAKLHPTDDGKRFEVLRRQALADGLLDILLLWRQELAKPPEQQSQPHLAAFENKVRATLAFLEKEIDVLARQPLNIAHIAMACTLSYFDFRFPELDWRQGHLRLAQWHAEFRNRASMIATEVTDDS